MKNALDWIKSNAVVSASAFVALLGILAIAYFYFVSAPAYSAAKSDILKDQKQRQNALMNIPVPLPNEDPNSPPDIHSVVVNQSVISKVSDIYQKIQSQHEGILGIVEEKNALPHRDFMLGGTAIWPDANPTQFFDLYVRAAADYKQHFKALFEYNKPNPWNMPRMVAGNPPTDGEIQKLLAKTAFDFISSIGVQSTGDLSQSQAKALYAEQRMVLMNALTDRARRVHLYTTLPPEEDIFAPKEEDATDTGTPRDDSGFGPPVGGGFDTPTANNSAPKEYPFLIEPWANADQPPTPDQLWEGQVQLWIVRDIMYTISRVNQVGKEVDALGPDGAKRSEPASVMNSPIKRLLKLHTLPGYVGLHSSGAVMTESDGDFSSGPTSFAPPPTDITLGATPSSTPNTPSVYPNPAASLAPKDPAEKAAEHFGITPTGRVSNGVFDVRHTRLVIDIEASKLPEFMNELHKTNFMSVIKAQVEDIDEYEVLQDGYVYGDSDVVRASLVVESLWFRKWTADLMPKLVKQKLLILPPDTAAGDGTDPGAVPF